MNNVSGNGSFASDLLAKHGRELYATCFRIAQRHDVADDLLQELFLRIARSDQIRNADSPVAYAKRIAINLAIDWRASRKKLRVEHTHKGLCTIPESQERSPENSAEIADQASWIISKIDALPPTQQEVVIMRFVEELSYSEIAAVTNRSEHRVRGLVAKALKSLRKLLSESQLKDAGQRKGSSKMEQSQ